MVAGEEPEPKRATSEGPTKVQGSITEFAAPLFAVGARVQRHHWWKVFVPQRAAIDDPQPCVAFSEKSRDVIDTSEDFAGMTVQVFICEARDAIRRAKPK